VFCCFNNNYKITPDAFDIWMRLLHRVHGSVLWLYRGDDAAAAQLQAHARSRGVDAARIVWAGHLELAEHLARHAHAGLFLDTFNCNAHTTSSDALWAGLPVLTLEGSTFASRVGASLLKAIGMPELICSSAAEYEETAYAIATSPQRAAELKQRLAEHRTRFALFDAARFTRRLEAAFETMCLRHRQGLAPDHFRVANST
jgi:predicted O-linked N-acetylglucosamine transferase (SPINDLY family)